MLNVYISAWLASILYAFEAIFTKLSVKYSISNSWHFNFFLQLFTLILTIPVCLYFGAGIPHTWFYIIIGAFLYSFSGIFYVMAVNKLDISVLSPLWSFRTAITVLIGFFFLNETLTAHQYIAIFVIFIFGIFVSLDEKFNIKSFFQKGILYALGCMIVIIGWAACIKKVVPVEGFWTTMLWVSIIEQFFLLFTIRFFKKDFHRVKVKNYWPVLATAIIATVAMFCSTSANAQNISIASAIVTLPISVPLAVLFSIFVPKLLEKHSWQVYTVRIVSATIMTIAALYL